MVTVFSNDFYLTGGSSTKRTGVVVEASFAFTHRADPIRVAETPPFLASEFEPSDLHPESRL